MRNPTNVKALEEFGRVRLSQNFFMRDFLYSEIAAIHGIQNIPDDPDLAIAAGSKLCGELLELLQQTFGRIAIRSAYRSCEVNELGQREYGSCASNEKNYAAHIWDRRDADGCMGATACIVVPWFLDQYERTGDWRPLAWWIHDHLPYSSLVFYPKFAAFNIRWHERSKRSIQAKFGEHKGYLTKLGMDNQDVSHAESYKGFPKLGLPRAGGC